MKVLLSISILSLFLGLVGSVAAAETIPPPLKQHESVSDFHDIKCKSHLTLIFKADVWTPACVKPSSVDKLIERGWATDHDPHHMDMTEMPTEPAITYPEQANISMELTACFGFCPTYSVTISEDGSVTFIGYENVKQLGTVDYSITESEVISIVEKIYESGFYGLEDEYDPNITDVPRIIISANLDGDVKSVKSPSHTMPESLKKVAVLIADLTNVQEHVGEKQSFFEQQQQEQVTILYVNSNLVDCVGVDPQKCMQVRENPNSSWEFFYDRIEGFDFQEGTNYKLEVIIEEIENPPADASSLRYILYQILESNTEINSKRLPVSVPDATHENDMLCLTHWNVITSKDLDIFHLKQSIQSTIAQFGITYVLEEREITVSQNSEGYKVGISGLWDRESVQYSMITADIESFSDSEIQGEPAMCQ